MALMFGYGEVWSKNFKDLKVFGWKKQRKRSKNK